MYFRPLKIEVISPFTSGSEAPFSYLLILPSLLLPLWPNRNTLLTESPFESMIDHRLSNGLGDFSITIHSLPPFSKFQYTPKSSENSKSMSLSLVICLQCICARFATKSHCIWDMKSPKNLNDGTPITMAKQLGCPRKLGSHGLVYGFFTYRILHSWGYIYIYTKIGVKISHWSQAPFDPIRTSRAPGVPAPSQRFPQIGPSAFVPRDPNRGDMGGGRMFLGGRKWSTFSDVSKPEGSS